MNPDESSAQCALVRYVHIIRAGKDFGLLVMSVMNVTRHIYMAPRRWTSWARPMAAAGRAVAAALVLLFVLMAGHGQALALDICSVSQFGVGDVEVDRVANSAQEARRLGLRDAQRKGFERVLTRLLRAPEAEAEFLASNQADRFVDFFHIREEKNLEGRYIARLDYCFDPVRLRKAFRSAGLKWAELGSPRILVLPVWLAPDGARAWQADNLWLSGWREVLDGTDGLVDFSLLEPTLTNERSLRSEDILAGDAATLRRAARIAEAEQVVRVIARLYFRGSQPVLAVDGELLTADAERIAIVARMAGLPIENSLHARLDFARTRIIQDIEEGWHRANIQGGDTREITVHVPVEDIGQWSNRLDVFVNVAVIESYVVRWLDINGGIVTLTVAGNDATLDNALASHSLRLRRRQDGSNVIEPL